VSTEVPDTIAGLGPSIALGRTADIYRLPDGRVLKLFFADVPRADVETERDNCDEAVALGVTPIACHGLVEVEGRLGLAFDPLIGPSVNALAERNILRMRAVARQLGREHVRVHRAVTAGHEDVRELAVRLLADPVFDPLGDEVRGRVVERIRALPGGDRLLHLDYHSQNVFRHGDGYAVIDWQTSARGAPAADVAMSMVVMRDGELWPGTPFLKRVLYDAVRKVFAAAYLAGYLGERTVTPDEVERWRIVGLVLRIGAWKIASERERMLAEITRLATEADAA
jgi:hypothetical protein